VCCSGATNRAVPGGVEVRDRLCGEVAVGHACARVGVAPGAGGACGQPAGDRGFARAIAELPVVSQSPRRAGALLDLLNRRLRVASESALQAAGLRPRHLLTLTLLRDLGESSQADLATTLQVDRTNLVGLLNELESEGQIERRR
jgi:hypothetical protein